MSQRLVFHDLAGPERPPTPHEDQMLTRVASDSDPSQLVVSMAPSVAASEPGPILERNLDGSWRAGRYIGELRRGDMTLEIRPRLDMAVIADWASAILNVRVIPNAAEHAGTSALIAELVAATWRAAVVEAARHGLPGLRADQRRIGADVRGRIEIGATIRLRAARRPALASVSRPKQIDNPVSRAIVLAERVLDRRLSRPRWRGDRLEEIMPRLRGATGDKPTLPTFRELSRVRYTPITQAYKRAAEISWQIAHNRGLRASATSEASEGLLIDVAELWELFLLHCAKRAFGPAQVIHGTRMMKAKPLLTSDAPAGGSLGRLYPDILIGTTQRPDAIIDAKYKPLQDPRGVDREDLYQLGAYLTGYATEPPPLGMLGYTQFPDQVAVSYAEARNPWRTRVENKVRFERLPITAADCVERLREIVPSGGPAAPARRQSRRAPGRV